MFLWRAQLQTALKPTQGTDEKDLEDQKCLPIKFVHKQENKEPKTSIVISEDGKKVKATHPPPSIFSCGWALVTSNARLEWTTLRMFKIKCISRMKHDGDAIGIITAYETGAFRFGGDPNCFRSYCLWFNGDITWCKGGNHSETLQKTGIKWGKDDIISVRVDAINWEVTFEKNGKIVGKPEDIKKHDVYYPAIQMCQCEGQSYEVVDE